MRRTHLTVLLTSVFALSNSAFAADAGTYRPGNTYNSIAASTADVCEMQCSGDAQCRSWNFVQIQKMAEGVCEFNDNVSSPQPSAISVSGNNVSRARSSRVSSGGTNTVRVGAPSVTQAAARVQTPRPSTARPASTFASQTSRVVTQPALVNSHLAGRTLMEQQRMNSQARSRSQMTPPHAAPRQGQAAQARINPRQFRHSLEEGRAAPFVPSQSAPTAMAAAPVAPSYGDPRLQARLMQQQRQGNAQAQAPRTQPTPQSSQTYPPVMPAAPTQEFASASSGLSAPPGVPPLSAPPGVPPLQNQPQLPPSYMSPSMAGAPPAPSQRRVSIPSELSPRPMGSGDQLFGSLFDDVKVPRPLDPSIAADPDAPIPTVSSRPVAPVQTAPLPPVR